MCLLSPPSHCITTQCCEPLILASLAKWLVVSRNNSTMPPPIEAILFHNSVVQMVLVGLLVESGHHGMPGIKTDVFSRYSI